MIYVSPSKSIEIKYEQSKAAITHTKFNLKQLTVSFEKNKNDPFVQILPVYELNDDDAKKSILHDVDKMYTSYFKVNSIHEVNAKDMQDELIYLDKRDYEETNLYQSIFQPLIQKLTENAPDRYEISLGLIKGARKKPQYTHTDRNQCTIALTVNRPGTLYIRAEDCKAIHNLQHSNPNSDLRYLVQNLPMQQTPEGSMLIMSSEEHNGGGIFHKQPQECNEESNANGLFIGLSITQK
jgi:hypothetical protein